MDNKKLDTIDIRFNLKIGKNFLIITFVFFLILGLIPVYNYILNNNIDYLSNKCDYLNKEEMCEKFNKITNKQFYVISDNLDINTVVETKYKNIKGEEIEKFYGKIKKDSENLKNE